MVVKVLDQLSHEILILVIPEITEDKLSESPSCENLVIETQTVIGEALPTTSDQNNNIEEVPENFGNDAVAIYVTKVKL